MIQKDYNDYYLRTTWIDRLIYTILIVITFNDLNTFADIKGYLNRRILLKNLLQDKFNSHTIFIEAYKNTLYFKSNGYEIRHELKINSITLRLGELIFIHFYDKGDTKITKQIIEILNKIYHEHQQQLISKSTYQEENN